MWSRSKNIEDASRVTAGPRSLAILEEDPRMWKALWNSFCKNVENNLNWDFSDTGWTAELPEKLSITFWRQCAQKCIKKSYQKSLKIEENWGLEGALGGLGACLEPCWPGLAAEARKCTPDVAKVVQFGANLGVKLEPKSFKKSRKNCLIFVFFLELSWKRNWHRNHSKMEAEIDSKTLSRELGSESGESVILNNATTF